MIATIKSWRPLSHAVLVDVDGNEHSIVVESLGEDVLKETISNLLVTIDREVQGEYFDETKVTELKAQYRNDIQVVMP